MHSAEQEGVVSELRGFAPIGILECWNTGMLGLKGVLFLFLFFTSFQYSLAQTGIIGSGD